LKTGIFEEPLMKYFVAINLILVVFCSNCGRKQVTPSLVLSLTDGEYLGQKHYFGWGAADFSDPQMMHNEVKYDVLHTHDIFTENVGGSYIGTKAIGPEIDREIIVGKWQELKEQIASDDMYLQYSSGHGYRTGLGVGVSYDEIRDNALSYPAKEIIIFTMACKSGGLVDSFDRAREQWEDFASEGRNLLVMASSRTWEDSSTGPGRDPDEEDGPYGSAGSAFGHALWKALIGYGDGYVDGVKDGYLTLEEIVEFTTWKTERVGYHTPVITGSYNGMLIMNRVPEPGFVDALDVSTEALSDDEIRAKIHGLNRFLAVE
jgi:hypothetical protein